MSKAIRIGGPSLAENICKESVGRLLVKESFESGFSVVHAQVPAGEFLLFRSSEHAGLETQPISLLITGVHPAYIGRGPQTGDFGDYAIILDDISTGHTDVHSSAYEYIEAQPFKAPDINPRFTLTLIEPDKLLGTSHIDANLSIVSVKGDDENGEINCDLRVASMAQVRVQRGSEFFSRVVFIRDLQPGDQLHVKDESGIQLNVSVVQVKPLLSLVLPS